MTAWIRSMPLPVPERTPSQTGDILPVPTSDSIADVEARRIALGVSRGDEAAFRELYDRYHERLFRLAVMLTQADELLAGEIVQSVFVTTASRLRRVESEAHLWNWLARVARQHLSKAIRQRQRDPT